MLLLVEDEVRWSAPMKDLVEAELGNLNGEVRVCTHIQSAIAECLRAPVRLASLDARLPSETDAKIEATAAKSLLANAYYSRLPIKSIVYSSLNAHDAGNPKSELAAVASTSADESFAKSKVDMLPSNDVYYEHLTRMSWAARVARYLSVTERTFEPYPQAPKVRSVVGAWLAKAPEILPPLLSRLAQVLDTTWDGAGSEMERIDAAIRFIENCASMALAQSAVLVLASAGPDVARQREFHTRLTGAMPSNNEHSAVLAALESVCTNWQPRLDEYHWLAWCSPKVRASLVEANKLRNGLRHGRGVPQGRKVWTELLPHLRAAMDLSTYWALHPLHDQLEYRPREKRWNGHVLASSKLPRPRADCDPEADFPGEAVQPDGRVWQAVALKSAAGSSGIRLRCLHWDHWLTGDVAEQSYRLLLWHSMRPPLQARMDLTTGETRISRNS